MYSKPEGLPLARPSGPSNASHSESGRGNTFVLDLDLLFHRSAFVKGDRALSVEPFTAAAEASLHLSAP